MDASIYIVDADQAGRDSIQILLETYGFRVHGFTSGEAFLDSYDGRRACLLLDIHTSGRSGAEVLRQISRRWTDLPVIVISGRAEQSHRPALVADGAADILPKPFADTVIVAAIERALDRVVGNDC